MRQYRIFVRKKKHYEVVPVGFAWGFLFLGAIWVLVYGLLFRYIAVLVISAIPLLLASMLDEPVRNHIGVLGVITMNAGHIFFAFKAFEWKESQLLSQSYEIVASVSARSASSALENWSRSDDASRFLEGSA